VRAKHRKLDDPSTAGGKQSSSIVQAISKGQLTTPTSQITAQHAEEVLPERFTSLAWRYASIEYHSQ
jgi:hypothetical protein